MRATPTAPFSTVPARILYVTGDLDGNVYAAQLTSLSPPVPAPPTDLLDESYPFQDSNGNAVSSVGNGVAVDSQGNVDLATTFQLGGDAVPGSCSWIQRSRSAPAAIGREVHSWLAALARTGA